MEKFLAIADPYIIKIGIDKLSREVAGLEQSINVLSSAANNPEAKRRIDKYTAERDRQIEILKSLKVKIKSL